MGRRLAAVALLPLLVLAACGGDDDAEQARTTTAAPAAEAAKPFPKATPGMTEDQLLSRLDGQDQVYTFAPAFSMFASGEDRATGLLLDRGGDAVPGATAAFYTAEQDGSRVRGPFVAREEPFGIEPQFVSRETSTDPDRRDSFLSARITGLPQRGKVKLLVVGQGRDGRLLPADAATVAVDPAKAPPQPGDRAISVATRTADDVRGDLSKLSTRTPPAEDLHRESLDDVLGRKPVVLGFVTPALCQSRVCGPSADVMEQVRQEIPEDRLAMIHQEIYTDNDANKGLQPPVARWRLLSEPWIFVIDRSGRISSRFEGPISVRQLEAAVREVTT